MTTTTRALPSPMAAAIERLSAIPVFDWAHDLLGAVRQTESGRWAVLGLDHLTAEVPEDAIPLGIAATREAAERMLVILDGAPLTWRDVFAAAEDPDRASGLVDVPCPVCRRGGNTVVVGPIEGERWGHDDGRASKGTTQDAACETCGARADLVIDETLGAAEIIEDLRSVSPSVIRAARARWDEILSGISATRAAERAEVAR